MENQNIITTIKNYCTKSIEHFFQYSEKGWKPNYMNNPHLGYFGEGTSGENGIRTLSNYTFVAAFIYAKNILVKNSTISRNEILDRALKSMFYLVQTHKTGNLSCTDGKKWGGDWQSSWWTMKLVQADQLLRPYVPSDKHYLSDDVLIFEANQHLNRTVPTGLTEDTKAEENAWDNEVMAAATVLLPNHTNHESWKNKHKEFSYNTLSTPQDLYSKNTYGNDLICNNVYTVNLHSDYTLENHGSLHFCYIASTLLSITWSAYTYLRNKKNIPPELLHNIQGLWRLAKPMFLGERFAYIGGKDWARYTYGLYFIVPVLYFLKEYLSDKDAGDILIKRLKVLRDEQDGNSDGSFYGDRITHQCMYGQEAKYETDCFACMALTNLLTECSIPKSEKKEFFPNEMTIVSPESYISYSKSNIMFASFSWKTLVEQNPIGLFIPSGMDNLAEWFECNLFGRIKTSFKTTPVGIRAMKQIENGFKISGKLGYRYNGEEIYQRIIEYNVNTTVGVAQVSSKLIVTKDFFCIFSEGLSYAIANDKFNNYIRVYHSDSERSKKVTFSPKYSHCRMLEVGKIKKIIKLLKLNTKTYTLGKKWINIDNKIGVISLDNNNEIYKIYSDHERNTAAKCLHYDLICRTKHRSFFMAKKGEVLFNYKVLLHTGDTNCTKELYKRFKKEEFVLDSYFVS